MNLCVTGVAKRSKGHKGLTFGEKIRVRLHKKSNRFHLRSPSFTTSRGSRVLCAGLDTSRPYQERQPPHPGPARPVPAGARPCHPCPTLPTYCHLLLMPPLTLPPSLNAAAGAVSVDVAAIGSSVAAEATRAKVGYCCYWRTSCRRGHRHSPQRRCCLVLTMTKYKSTGQGLGRCF